MIGHAEKLRLLTDVEMIAEVLSIVFVTYFVDPCRQKLEGFLMHIVHGVIGTIQDVLFYRIK